MIIVNNSNNSNDNSNDNSSSNNNSSNRSSRVVLLNSNSDDLTLELSADI